MRKLFEPREHFKPFEYQECEEFISAISESYWTHKEWSFSTDVSEYHSTLTEYQRNIVKKCLILISQIEVSVKTFFLKLGEHIPKPEISMVGATFAESEVRHSLAYSHLLEILGLNEEFEKIYDIPVIINRHKYLKKYKEFCNARLEENFLKSIILFSLFIENVALFSQFFILMSFNKHRKLLKDINNAVSATSKEESIHALFGTFLINEMRKENPEFFTEELKKMVENFARKSYEAEEKSLEWVFDQGDLDFVKVESVKEFLKDRINKSLTGIGFDEIFETDKEVLRTTKWFEEDLVSESHFDFFHQRPVSYSRFGKAITADDLF